MADSTLTKRALANALKELMLEEPFEKINVTQICERCDMNRKSFYYHFKDKYDLVNWIFDTDFISIINKECKNSRPERWELLEDLCECFYENRSFYRKALQIRGQNSFPEHFRECLQPILTKRLEELLDTQMIHPFVISFLTDSIICAFERWLLDKNCMPPQQVVSLVVSVISSVSVSIYKELEEKER